MQARRRTRSIHPRAGGSGAEKAGSGDYGQDSDWARHRVLLRLLRVAYATDAAKSTGLLTATLTCGECGRESDADARGWLAFRVDLPDDDEEAEVTCFFRL